ncbi:MAG: protein sphX [Deltaproteobacteria bacterium CG11_big_fil_rev_8_21_14_0_20_45_16]|nr:MAG: protein sphX [Deltaproteobacteria bacterium CG11_big_fil_rev_8_21_14_0_20_45_16]
MKFWLIVATIPALSIFNLESSAAAELRGQISIDGSSTVYPLSEAVAEEALTDAQLKKVRVGVKLSGTGGGFKKLCHGEIDLSGASRPIKTSEIEACKANKVEFVEIPVAYDGIAVVVNPANTCINELSVEQLNKIWGKEADGKINNWKQVNEKCPDLALKLYGPGTDSGTFDYFTEVINGESKSSRADFVKSEDDNMLVTGVSREKGGLGYFGFAYYQENKDKLRLIPIKASATSEAVLASPATIANGAYAPLSRPIFIYVSKKAAERPEVKAFVDFYIRKSAELANSVGYVALGDSAQANNEIYSLISKRFDLMKTGSLFQNEAHVKISLRERLK